MAEVGLFMWGCAIILLSIHRPRRINYRDERNGCWIAQERSVMGGTLTTWKPVDGGRY
jgi:hypothetical protein